ncbi:pullulanase-type alpha-1,6-glucosidase, partial [Streptomyces lonarensis]
APAAPATGATPAAATGESAAAADPLDLTEARAHWIDRSTVVWPLPVEQGATWRLLHDATGSLSVADGEVTGPGTPLTLTPTTLTDEQRARFPHLADQQAFTLDEAGAGTAAEALRGQLVAEHRGPDGALLHATGVQIPGVLDDLYAAEATAATLGPSFPDSAHGAAATDRHSGAPHLAVWAPTAQQVRVEVDGELHPMRRDDATGVWSATGPADWYGAAYRYHVTVWAPEAGAVVTNEVTDPYSTALTTDSAHSLVVDLADPALAPDGWADAAKPEAVPMARAAIQEIHVRDFSVADPTAEHPGRYLAFAEQDSDGVRQLQRLSDAGTTHLHLLPTNDIGSVPENPADRREPDCDLASLAPDSPRQQECVGQVRDRDAYNWGYDPLHFNVPEGSYATDADGTARTVEFREMVRALNARDLRVVVDVVYNHTFAAGQDDRSILDRVVPGYYHRLLADGSVADSTCCPNTAPEHAMMGKLTVDSVVLWARHYRVDGFRFDLMGHHPKQNLLDVRAALDALTPERDGVDGSAVVLYGEGWNFGEVADDARFEQATQRNMAGTGIATFSDRARDAVRGGGPFDEDPGVQGFGSGLWSDPNGSPANGSSEEQLRRLLSHQDLIKVGLTGNLADYRFTDSRGREVTGAEVDYNGSPAGYTAAPGEAVAYVDKHDNEALFDALAYKLPADTAPADRARMQVLATATALLSQGAVFGQAGTELLRSKSLDRNSYDSGDWFNAIHWNCEAGNGFGRGLPPAWDNEDKWPWAAPLLTEESLRVGCAEIRAAEGAYRDLLTIRTAEDAFGLTTLDEVQRTVSFPLSGTEHEAPGVITMRAGDLVVVLNATPGATRQHHPSFRGAGFALHPVQEEGADPVVREASFDAADGTFEVPGRTVAVFTLG